ncbi:hypothetical protein EXU57_24580 [Segetibacter sp. 3557_3]|uniref:lanthionine synthetase LanC family protein n=1 Tax=Segetibacter sp. 3557_3 TaxID=2547429 RepID=UPI0010591859|nr:lanthionine synthetase LanC family protein [Segetibacter sp. 3557_3]TDH18052.1 hypothetical protein EXU57_24580 [Segetibacter sp. 3557_3]
MNWKDRLEKAIESTQILSDTNFSWFGVAYPQIPEEVRQSLLPKTKHAYLIRILSEWLYRGFYCMGEATDLRLLNNSIAGIEKTFLYQQLPMANQGLESWHKGWTVIESFNNGIVIIENKGLRISVHREEISENHSIKSQTTVQLKGPNGLFDFSPGYYTALSEISFPPGNNHWFVRIYLNLDLEGSFNFLKIVTTELNKIAHPFILKVHTGPELQWRCDSVVLIILKKDFSLISKLLTPYIESLRPHLGKNNPAFTKWIGWGIGLAESPKGGISFGENRCAIMAKAIVSAEMHNIKTLSGRFREIERHFQEQGLSLDIPYLNSVSRDDYGTPFNDFQVGKGAIPSVSRDASSIDFLNAASQIGIRLTRNAVWHEQRCNWLASGRSSQGKKSRFFTSNLSPDLYSGTSGVALFLAHLYANTQESRFRTTALGAIRQAISKVDTIPDHLNISAYAGNLGIALAAAKIGEIFNSEELLKASIDIWTQIVHKNRQNSCDDWLLGKAGAIVATILLADIHKDQRFLDFALILGDEILDSAEKSVENSIKRTTHGFAGINLTGFSHGSLGIVFALLTLYRISGNSKYCKYAQQALENKIYWPNNLIVEGSELPGIEATKISENGHDFNFFGWCHGPSGDALSWLLANDLLHQPNYKAEAISALQRSYESTKNWLDHGHCDYCLCHGLTGNSEILLYGHQSLKSSESDWALLALRVANSALEYTRALDRAFDIGAISGEDPSLMQGNAGIGYFFLRLYNPNIPSILTLTR